MTIAIIRPLNFCVTAAAFAIVGVSCDGTRSDERAGPVVEKTADSPAAVAAETKSQRDGLDDPEYIALFAKGEELASLSPQERRAKWWDDDPVPRTGPSIGTILPQISGVRAIAANLTDDDGDSVQVQIPESQWQSFYELLENSEPVELNSEILIIANFKITKVDGSEVDGAVLSMFANPLFFAMDDPKSEDKGWVYFATTQSELEILNFFEALRDKPTRSRLRGWFPYRTN